MAIARGGHTVTLLNDGRVLVAGAFHGGVGLGSTEIYDPAADTWSASGDMINPRGRHGATLLNDGRVLVAGGVSGGASLSSAEIYDPATGAWSATGNMISARNGFPSVLLNDGRVLVIGGGLDMVGSCCAEVFDPVGVGTPTPSPTPDASITVTVPNGGEVWLIGSTQTIQWNSQGFTGNVRIQFSRDGGASYIQIANNVPNTGTFQWKVTKPATTQALIRVTSINQPNVQDTSDSLFRIRR